MAADNEEGPMSHIAIETQGSHDELVATAYLQLVERQQLAVIRRLLGLELIEHVDSRGGT